MVSVGEDCLHFFLWWWLIDFVAKDIIQIAHFCSGLLFELSI